MSGISFESAHEVSQKLLELSKEDLTSFAKCIRVSEGAISVRVRMT
jgi:hypothetical protein